MHSFTLNAIIVFIIICLSGGLWFGANVDDCCQEGWIKSGTHCYQYVSTPADFVTAEASCINKGGNLVSIHSRTEMDTLRWHIRRITGEDTRIWTGGYYSIEGVWRWTDGSEFDLPPWAPQQPDNQNGTEHCMELNWNKALNDHGCDKKKPYLCSIQLHLRHCQ